MGGHEREAGSRPVAGRDYPRTYQEFRAWFPNDEACAAFLERLRWPDGFVCPACGIAGKAWRQTRDRLTCRVCRHQTRVTAGTVLDKTARRWWCGSSLPGT